MEFDKSRVYTSLTADELSPGDKVICAYSMGDLKHYVKRNGVVLELQSVLDENNELRFVAGTGKIAFHLAYLVERKENCTNCELCERTNASDDEEYECSPKGYIGDKERAKICRCLEWKPKTEQKVEKQYRPFINTDELVKVWCDKGGKWQKRELTMPYIWVRNKERGSQELIVAYNGDMFLTEYAQGNMERLLEWYTFLDGSPCGVEE